MFGVTDDYKVMCIGLCTSDSKGSKSCISNSFTKEKILTTYDVLSYMLDYENLENQGVPLSRVSQCNCQQITMGLNY
jgi:hypothetical protein